LKRRCLSFGITLIFIISTVSPIVFGFYMITSLTPAINSNISNELAVYFIDVGQGDCILIQTPENNYILIDTGYQQYAQTVIDFLSDLSVTTLLAFIGTHPHADHIGGCEEIFNEFEILSIYHPGYPYDSETYQRFLNAAQNEGCPIYTDDEVDPGDNIDINSTVTCQILHIDKSASNANDASIVLRLDYEQVSFLFTGDINGDQPDYVESYLVDNWDVDVDVLKVPHHGSKYSSTNYFLDEVTPAVSVICCGINNPYGHPHPETLLRLGEHDSLIYRTDLNSTVLVKTNGLDWSVFYTKPNHSPYPPSDPIPPDGADSVPFDINLCWVGGDPNLGDTVTYDLYFGVTNPPTKKSSNQTVTFYDPPGDLLSYKVYYWGVVAWSNGGLCSQGPIWKFSTDLPPPNQPIIDGPKHGRVGVEYTYTFNSTDYYRPDFYYEVDWGDGFYETVNPTWPNPEVPGPGIANHSWCKKGTYVIKARIHDAFGYISPWGKLTVYMPRDKAIITSQFLKWLQSHPNMFPILKQILGS